VSTELSHGELQGTTGPNRVSLEKSGVGQNAYQLHDADVVRETCDYLEQLGQQKKSNPDTFEPFCVTVGLMLPHQPFVASKEDYEYYDGKVGLPKLSGDNLDEVHPYLKEWRKSCGILEVSETEQIRARTAYYALVTRMDKMIGQIFSTLKEQGLDENTLIVYSSDHGEQIGERGLWWKQTFYENSVQVPLIMSHPDLLPQNETLDEVVSSLDLNATMLDLIQAPPLPSSRGRSLVPLMKGETSSWENIAFSEFCLDDGTVQRMVRKNQYKYIYYLDYPPQLFDLETDPDELQDLAGQPEFSELEKELHDKVLSNWDPVHIREHMAIKKQEYEIIENWARKTKPEERYIWPLSPDMDYLDKDYVYKDGC
jgi:choline-sulfatase